MGRLFLASEAKHPESMDKLGKFVGGLKGKNVAFIPTAYNGNNPYGEWVEKSTTWEMLNKLDVNVSVVTLEEYRNASVIKKLENKDILWFAGGATGYLLYWIRRCLLDKNLSNLLDSGSVYVGSSAGSMACSKTQYASELYIDAEEPGASLLPGYGFINFEMYPHYNKELLPKLKQVWKHEYGDLYLLKDGEAITVVDNKIKVLGEKRILRNGKLI